MNNFSSAWKSSKKPGKQRKYRLRAPLHVKQKLSRSHLSAALRKKYGKRNIGLRKGDKVKIMRGSFKRHEGNVERIDLKKCRVFISGVERAKKDGTKKPVGIEPSNLMITELSLEDRFRQKALERR